MRRENHADEDFAHLVGEVVTRGRYAELKRYCSHGDVTVYRHCLAVARTADTLARRLCIPCDRRALVRGALLHDYYLYDWHDPNKGFRWHGFKHHRFALRNAERDFPLTVRERDIIRTHMFPLTFWCPPGCREAWLVSVSDKLVAAAETLRRGRA